MVWIEHHAIVYSGPLAYVSNSRLNSQYWLRHIFIYKCYFQHDFIMSAISAICLSTHVRMGTMESWVRWQQATHTCFTIYMYLLLSAIVANTDLYVSKPLIVFAIIRIYTLNEPITSTLYNVINITGHN